MQSQRFSQVDVDCDDIPETEVYSFTSSGLATSVPFRCPRLGSLGDVFGTGTPFTVCTEGRLRVPRTRLSLRRTWGQWKESRRLLLL